jgi:hypothetical protein
MDVRERTENGRGLYQDRHNLAALIGNKTMETRTNSARTCRTLFEVGLYHEERGGASVPRRMPGSLSSV